MFLFAFTACQEGGEAGELWGQWRMADSEEDYAKYVSFSGPVLMFKGILKGDLYGREVYGNFQHVGDSLFIQCCSVKEQLSDTTMVEDRFGFKPFNDIRVKIVTLDGDDLVLDKNGQTWRFYKY